jgi:hypothetical protein
MKLKEVGVILSQLVRSAKMYCRQPPNGAPSLLVILLQEIYIERRKSIGEVHVLREYLPSKEWPHFVKKLCS